MSVSPQWKFLLANSNDLSHVGELKAASGRSLQLALNRAGSLSFSLPMSDDLAQYIWPITSAIKAYRRGSDNAWQLIWSGMVWTIDENITGNTMQVSAVGWLQRLDKRIMRRAKDYTANNPATGAMWKDSEIIFDLLADANTTLLTWDTPTSYPAGYPVPVVAGSSPATPTLIGPGVATGDFSTHGRQYKIDRLANILGEFQKLTDLENGVDIEVNPATRLLNTWAKKMTDRPNAIFGYGWGPNNVKDLSRQLDSSTVVDYMLAAGQDTSIVPRFADTQLSPDPTQNPPLLGENSMKTYGLFEEAVSLSDAKTTEILATYAGGEVLLRSSPRIVYGITPFPFTTTLGPGRIPEPFVNYQLGDKVYLSAYYKKRVSVDKMGMRVFGITVAPDDQGNEIIQQLQIAP